MAEGAGNKKQVVIGIITWLLTLGISALFTILLNLFTDFLEVFPKDGRIFAILGAILTFSSIISMVVVGCIKALREKIFLWGIAVSLLVISAIMFIIPAYQTPDNSANSHFRIIKSNLDVYINNNGNATVTRTQCLSPLDVFTRTCEREFWSTGELSRENFSVAIQQVNSCSGPGLDTAKTCNVSYVEREKEVIIDHPFPLLPGSLYSRITKVEFEGAYIDKNGDFVLLDVPFLTDTLVISIQLGDGLEWREDNFRANLIKTGGAIQSNPPPLSETRDFELTNKKCTLLFIKPEVGNLYRFEWQYLVGHSPNPL
jgi:hypothetical protein